MAEASFLETWNSVNPGTYEAFFKYVHALEENCGLDEKTFQMIYIALQAHRGAIGSVTAHAGIAKRAGATREEVVGAVLVTLMTSGINGVADALNAVIAGYDAG